MAENFSVGLAALGYQGYSRKHKKLTIQTLKEINSDEKVLGILAQSFSKNLNNDLKNIKDFWKAFTTNSVLICYLSNEVDRRKRREDVNSILYKMSPGDLSKAFAKNDKKALDAYVDVAKKYYDAWVVAGMPGELFLALGLESQWSNKIAVNNLNKAIKKACPKAKTIHNPVKGSPFRGRGNCDYLEVHEVNERVPAENMLIASTDGFDICPNACGIATGYPLGDSEVIDSIKRFKKKARFYLLWHPQMNSLVKDSSTNPIPSKRKSSLERGCMQHLAKNIANVSLQEVDEIDAPDYPKGSRKGLKNPFKTGGFVWKESDHGGLVVVFPSNFTKLFDYVKVVPAEGWFKGLRTKKLNASKLYETGWANPQNGKNRQHWRHSKAAHKFTSPSVLIAGYNSTSKKKKKTNKKRKNTKVNKKQSKKTEFRWLIKDTSIRNGK